MKYTIGLHRIGHNTYDCDYKNLRNYAVNKLANKCNKKFELRQFRFSSLAENWGVHAKLIYKYQILYLDHMPVTIVPWRHLVNDIDLRRNSKSPKNPQNPLFWRSRLFKVIEFDANCCLLYTSPSP